MQSVEQIVRARVSGARLGVRAKVPAIAMAAIALSAGLLGCEEKRLLGVTASVGVSPNHLAYGHVTGLSPQAVRVSVSNEGTGPLQIKTIKISSSPNADLSIADQFTTDCDDQDRTASPSLDPGECARFTVVWTPASPHAATGSVEIDSSDVQDSVITLPVLGDADTPLLRICVLTAMDQIDPTLCSDLGANPQIIPKVDFGTGLTGQVSTKKVRLTNLGVAPLDFAPLPQISNSVGTPAIFKVSEAIPGGEIEPGASTDITLTATPTATGTSIGQLNVSSNDTRNPRVQVPLKIFVAGSLLCVDPEGGLDFGTVTIGEAPVLPIAFTNCGGNDFTINEFSFNQIAPTNGQFTIKSGSLPTVGSTLAAGDKITLGIAYAPTDVRSDHADIKYALNSGGAVAQGLAPIVGKGVEPVCGSTLRPNPNVLFTTAYGVNQAGPFTAFNPSARQSPVVPLDWVQIDSTSSTIAGAIPVYTWAITSQPAGSTTTIAGSGAVVTLQTLVAGDYVVQLTVADLHQCIGINSVTIHVVPAGAVHIELTWEEDCADIDLHYVAPGDSFCGANDVKWDNRSPDWGCATSDCGHEEDPGGYHPDNSSLDDATLDHDDRWGFGPENVTQKAPFDSPANLPYQIWVYYYSATPDGGGGSGICNAVHPRINVYIEGILRNSFTIPNGMAEFQSWHPADISVSEMGNTVVVIPRDANPTGVNGC